MVSGTILQMNVYAKDQQEAIQVFNDRQRNGQIIQITPTFL
mgnify:FL=1